MVKPIIIPFEWPLIMECGKCGGKLEVYPRPNEPKGWSICETCTPNYEFNKAFAAKMSRGYPGFTDEEA